MSSSKGQNPNNGAASGDDDDTMHNPPEEQTNNAVVASYESRLHDSVTKIERWISLLESVSPLVLPPTANGSAAAAANTSIRFHLDPTKNSEAEAHSVASSDHSVSSLQQDLALANESFTFNRDIVEHGEEEELVMKAKQDDNKNSRNKTGGDDVSEECIESDEGGRKTATISQGDVPQECIESSLPENEGRNKSSHTMQDLTDSESTPSISDSDDEPKSSSFLEPAPGSDEDDPLDIEAAVKVDSASFDTASETNNNDKQDDNLDSLERAETNTTTKRGSRKKVRGLCIGVLAGSILMVVLGVIYGRPPKEETTQVPETTIPPTVAPTNISGFEEVVPQDAEDMAHLMDELLQEFPDDTLANLQDPNTPQWKAWDWLSSHPSLEDMQTWRKKQLFALSAFYFAFEGPIWPEKMQETWLDETLSECLWFSSGPEEPCDSEGLFQSLYLSNLELSNYEIFIPNELAFLERLAILALPQNHINVGVEKLVPAAIVKMPRLSVLDLSGNSLNGPIPIALGLLRGLTSLDLSNNQLYSVIPLELSQLSFLQTLKLGSNALISTLPTELGLLTSSLTTLSIEKAPLYGALPTEIGQISSLQVLSLSDTGLNGQLHSELGLLSNLKELRLDGTRLTGTISKEAGLCEVPKLHFDCSDNLCGCDCECLVN